MPRKPAGYPELPDDPPSLTAGPTLTRPLSIFAGFALAAFLLGNGCVTAPKVTAKANLSIKELAAHGKPDGLAVGPRKSSESGELTGSVALELSWGG